MCLEFFNILHAKAPEGSDRKRLIGQCATLTGLQKKIHFNEKHGSVVKWMDDKALYQVQLDDGSLLAVKPENVACEPATVTGEEEAASSLNLVQERLRALKQAQKEKRTCK